MTRTQAMRLNRGQTRRFAPQYVSDWWMPPDPEPRLRIVHTRLGAFLTDSRDIDDDDGLAGVPALVPI